jgi:signal transduction histidine kinase
MVEVRNISNGLMPAVLTEFGLLTAIRNLAKEITESSGIDVIVRTSMQSIKLNAKFETYIYRIAQEALNNVIKHAEASEVSIELTELNNQLIFSVKDNGIGMSTTSHFGGNGLNNMKDRAALLFGKLEIISELGRGTEVRLELKNKLDEKD